MKKKVDKLIIQERKSVLEMMGKYAVAYELAKHKWQISLNLGYGYDLLAKKPFKELKIEVKSMDPTEKRGKYTKHLRQRVTKRELSESHFVIICIYGTILSYYIIPTKKIPKTGNIWMYISKYGIKGEYGKYKDRWDLLK